MEPTLMPLFTIAFHSPNCKFDGKFIEIPAMMVGEILNQLPSGWLAIIYNADNIPVTSYHTT
jgi:hypothetical protein